jgi:hypothetical protein
MTNEETISAAELPERGPAPPPGRPTQDEQLLSDEHRHAAFTDTDTWRVFRIMGEFVAGFDTLATMGKAVSILARLVSNPDTRNTRRRSRLPGS